MPLDLIYMIAGIVFFGSHLLEGITGFGSTVIALPFLSLAISIKTAVPVLCISSCFLAIYILCRSWRAIQWKEFLFIAVHAALGMPLGMLLFDRLPAEGLCIVLGLFMVMTGYSGTRRTIQEKAVAPPAVPASGKKSLAMRLILFAGGIIQGSLGSGGPLVVIYAAKALPEKSSFRATLSLLWLVMNTWRLIDWAVKGTLLDADIGKYTLIALPFAAIGVVAGDYLHSKVNAFVFRLCVYTVLAAAGILMLIKNTGAILHGTGF